MFWNLYLCNNFNTRSDTDRARTLTFGGPTEMHNFNCALPKNIDEERIDEERIDEKIKQMPWPRSQKKRRHRTPTRTTDRESTTGTQGRRTIDHLAYRRKD